MSEKLPVIEQGRLIQYICAALLMDNAPADPALVERILTLEMEYLQHHGIAERAIDDPRPESEL